MSSHKTIIAFDLYGTLLSTESIAQELSQHYEQDKAASVAASWRRYQLEYTWRLNSMGQYQAFDQVTRAALRHATAEQGYALTTQVEDQLLDCYNRLQTFPEIPSALQLLGKSNGAADACVFSNGTENMVSSSILRSPSIASHAALFKALVTVDACRCYKPAPKAYSHLLEQVGVTDNASRVWLVTANPFDVVGAKAAGLMVAWIDRAGKGWLDRMDEALEPSIITKDVEQAVQSILEKV